MLEVGLQTHIAPDSFLWRDQEPEVPKVEQKNNFPFALPRPRPQSSGDLSHTVTFLPQIVHVMTKSERQGAPWAATQCMPCACADTLSACKSRAWTAQRMHSADDENSFMLRS